MVWFGVAVVVAVMGLCLAASTQPDTYLVERKVKMLAAPADVFPYVNDFDRWAVWNPWAKKDPTMKMANSTPTFGVGAWTTWEGNADVGSGRMSIVESVPGVRVVQELIFREPFEDKGRITFSLASAGEGTALAWTMEGGVNFFGKLMCLFSSMDAMIGPDFEQGLASLKPLAEADAAARIDAEKVASEAAAAAAVPAEGATAPVATPSPSP